MPDGLADRRAIWKSEVTLDFLDVVAEHHLGKVHVRVLLFDAHHLDDAPADFEIAGVRLGLVVRAEARPGIIEPLALVANCDNADIQEYPGKRSRHWRTGWYGAAARRRATNWTRSPTRSMSGRLRRTTVRHGIRSRRAARRTRAATSTASASSSTAKPVTTGFVTPAPTSTTAL